MTAKSRFVDKKWKRRNRTIRFNRNIIFFLSISVDSLTTTKHCLETECWRALKTFHGHERCVFCCRKKINWNIDEMFVEIELSKQPDFCHSVESEQTNRKCVFVLSPPRRSYTHTHGCPDCSWFNFSGSFLTLNQIPEIKWTNRENEMQRINAFDSKKLNYSSANRVPLHYCIFQTPFNRSSTQNRNGRRCVLIDFTKSCVITFHLRLTLAHEKNKRLHRKCHKCDFRGSFDRRKSWAFGRKVENDSSNI